MDPNRLAAMEDSSHLLMNTQSNNIYDDIYQELDDICNLTKPLKEQLCSGRKTYASLDIERMGVDVHSGPLTLLNNNDNKRNIEQNVKDDDRKLSKMQQETVSENQSKDDLDSLENVPHIAGLINNDLYAIPMKKKTSSSLDQDSMITSSHSIEIDADDGSPEKENDDASDLPPGWEKHEDNDGPYYWHIKSGTIQREPPPLPATTNTAVAKLKNMLNKENNDTSALLLHFDNTDDGDDDDEDVMATSATTVGVLPRSNTTMALDSVEDRKRRYELSLKRRSYPLKATDCATHSSTEEQTGDGRSDRRIRFAVCSLGWVEIAEEDLTPERSSRAVNKCIVDLSIGRNDLLDVVGRWGDGKDLFMDLDEGALKLLDPESLTVLNTQPIHTIRVWGVGRDNGRDFAYVARDRTTRKHMCHVFRCDIPARTIANTLRDICKKIMIERSLQIQQNVTNTNNNGSIKPQTPPIRPTNLPMEQRRLNRHSQSFLTYSFPTPMEEPKKVLRAQYLGVTQVSHATGMDVLNDAISLLATTVPTDQWRPVNVAVAPSMISVDALDTNRTKLAECRVRYLSFLGIGKAMKHCAFIMHTAQDTFMAHVFYCEPSSGALCKTIEAACKLRYQKCLDAHHVHSHSDRCANNASAITTSLTTPAKSLGATLKSFVGTLTGRKSRSVDS